MNVNLRTLFRLRFSTTALTAGLVMVSMAMIGTHVSIAQDNEPAQDASGVAGTIIIKTSDGHPKPPVFFKATAQATVQVRPSEIEQLIRLNLKVIQGDAETVSLGLVGTDQVVHVEGKDVQSWAVRQRGEARFLDLHLAKHVSEADMTIRTQSPELQLPAQIELTHLSAGDAVGFHSVVEIEYGIGVEGSVTEAQGFSALGSEKRTNRLQTATGGRLQLVLNRDGAAAAAIELSQTTLAGEMHANANSLAFQLRTTALVTQADAEITILAGMAAVQEVISNDQFRIRLSSENHQPVYKLLFLKTGTFPISLDFVAPLVNVDANWRGIDFRVGAGAVVPVTLAGLEPDLEFRKDQQSIVPIREQTQWTGFLPATGRAQLHWKSARKTGEGKLFFAATSQIEAQVSAGLLRQSHQIQFQVLQGELRGIQLTLNGPGEILDVQGDNVVAWKTTGDAPTRQLDVTLSQPITSESRLAIRSQTPLGAFPLNVDGLRLTPNNAIRYSGFLRLTNSGSVRIEPTGLSGLTQLAPDQFPGEAIQARQVFAYRFPAAEYAFTIAADRIQPEMNVSQLVVYELGETDRSIQADIEIDVREAPVREFDFLIPSEYSVVSVTGASVGDYVAATTVTDGRRNLKIVFNQDVIGRQLVSLHLEKSGAAAEGDWELLRLEFPEAESVRGDIGVMGAPGFRVTVGAMEHLVEKPLSYFPKPMANLQQAFRIREPEWSATMRIESLPRSIQADAFHLYSLSQETIYGSTLINYFVTGAPVSEWKLTMPESLGNVVVDGKDVRTWRRDEDTLVVTLHQPVMGAYTLLVTYEEKPSPQEGVFSTGRVVPLNVQGERGFVHVVSPTQVEISDQAISEDVLKLDALELPAEFRLLSAAPSLGAWQYTDRPFQLTLKVNWFQPGKTVSQVVEFAEATSRVSQDGELVTDVAYFIKTRGQQTLRIKLPPEPVRLWQVIVHDQPVTARQTEDTTLIPLPGNVDPNSPVEVRLRLGKPSVRATSPELALPVVFAPVLKTNWKVAADEGRILVPSTGTVQPATPVLPASGLMWVTTRGLAALTVIGILGGFGIWGSRQRGIALAGGLLAMAIAVGLCLSTVGAARGGRQVASPLQLSLPVLSPEERVMLRVENLPKWRGDVSLLGGILAVAGVAAVGWSLTRNKEPQESPVTAAPEGTGTHEAAGDEVREVAVDVTAKPQVSAKPNRVRHKPGARCAGAFMLALGILLQPAGASWFFGLLGIVLLIQFATPGWRAVQAIQRAVVRASETRQTKEQADSTPNSTPNVETEPGGGTVTALLLIGLLSIAFTDDALAVVPSGFEAANAITQQWKVDSDESRLVATGSIELTGKPGDRFVLLNTPATLTHFEGVGLRLRKRDVPGFGLAYVVTIPIPTEGEEEAAEQVADDYRATFEYQLEALQPLQGIPVLTGPAAVQSIDFHYDEAGWEVTSATAVRIESVDDSDDTHVRVLLGPGQGSLQLKPTSRNVSAEQTQFFVEASNLYLTRPGVVDGRHRFEFRPSQGQVSALTVMVPGDLTVSQVSGPVGAWQFDADQGRLQIEVEPRQSQAFVVSIETQRSLNALPTDLRLVPLMVSDADGQVGLVAVAFGADAQPENVESETMSTVNLGDFDSSLLPEKNAVLHRVYRYGVDGGELSLRIAPVQPEIRVTSKQVLSLGDERVVLGINFVAEISRQGIFQLSFPLPTGFEVESLTGDSLHHWSELSDEGDDGSRQIVLHLNGKTMGPQTFSLTLGAPAPDGETWELPRFELNEAARQTGELVVRPTTGIRLRTNTRQNVSETDPRAMGGNTQGALAFRLLQQDWRLELGVEKLAAWVTGQVLHEVTLREGQTRTALFVNFNIENASVNSLNVELPIRDDDEIKTVRASGSAVSDIDRRDPSSNVWQILFKRRVVGAVQLQIEYERRGDRPEQAETCMPAMFPDAQQLIYHLAVRAGGRLEVEQRELPTGWQRVDWNAVPQPLRAQDGTPPTIVLRAVAPENPVSISARRHSLADALKLRVASGALTTILSPNGDQLTAVDLTMEVIQRSSLQVVLPTDGELFSIFVNGESVNSVHHTGGAQAWQFYVLPGMDDRTANVRFVYSVPAARLSRLRLRSPQLNVPLENIDWKIVAPKGFLLSGYDGDLELVRQTQEKTYDRESYLSKSIGKRQVEAEQAAQLLEQANQLLQAGEQTKARWAFNSVANRYALDAASNEDARVQLENLQTQQAIVGLNTRRQRLYIDNANDTTVVDNQQLREAAAGNQVLQQDQLNFRPQEVSQLLRGNTSEDNAVLQQIAERLVQHQRTTEPAPQAIVISLPEEGTVYTFARSVQVAEDAPLELDLRFGSQRQAPLWQSVIALGLLGALATMISISSSGQRRT